MRLRTDWQNKKAKPWTRKEIGLATYMNWHNPFIWPPINRIAKRVGYQMSPTAIVREAKCEDAMLFDKLS
jgi:hypothetical protein